jgi:hypothetical protein
MKSKDRERDEGCKSKGRMFNFGQSHPYYLDTAPSDAHSEILN